MAITDITGFQRQRRAQEVARAAEQAKEALEATKVSDDTEKLTFAELDEIMRNKGNVMHELKKHNAEFSDRSGVELLRAQLAKVLGEKGLLPDDNADQ